MQTSTSKFNVHGVAAWLDIACLIYILFTSLPSMQLGDTSGLLFLLGLCVMLGISAITEFSVAGHVKRLRHIGLFLSLSACTNFFFWFFFFYCFKLPTIAHKISGVVFFAIGISNLYALLPPKPKQPAA